MKQDEKKVNFDLFALELEELIESYESVVGFLDFLEETKIIVEEKVEKENG